MAIVITELADWLWVKNPCYVEITGGDGEVPAAKIQLYDGATLITESFYMAKNDYIKADISGIAKSIFDLVPDETVVMSETYLNRTVVVTIDGSTLYSKAVTFVYGGKDINDLFDLFPDFTFDTIGTTQTNFLQEFDRPTIFKDQPFGLWFCHDMHFISTTIAINVTAYDSADNLVDSGSYSIPSGDWDRKDILKTNPIEQCGITLTDQVKHIYIWVSGQGNTYVTTLHCNCVIPDCSNGVMLRWLNRVGGVHHWYFYQKEIKRPVKTNSVTLVDSIEFTDNWNHGIGKVVSKEFGKVIVLGADGVTTEDYEVIARINESDRVDMYVGSGNWIQVVLSDSDFSIDYSKDYHDIELTITTK